MEGSAKAAGHPIHQQLVVFPIGLLATAVVFDVLRYITGNGGFATAAYFMIAAGIVTGLLAAVFGEIDYLGIPEGTRAKRVGSLHALGNLVVLVLFAVSWLLRLGAPGHVPGVPAFVLGVAGALVATGTAWLGGELVDRLGVGVSEGAGLDAPPSYETGIRLRSGATRK